MKFKIMILFWLNLCLFKCLPRRIKSDIIQKFHRTGEAIAVDDLVREYEQEHQKFYEREISDGDHLSWSALDNKNLSNYCRNYLQHSVPSRTTDDATGIKIRNTLHYGNEHNHTISKVVMVQCKVRNKQYQLVYYFTRAPKPNCVYALKSNGSWNDYVLTIINKYCDFEEKPFINRTLKRKMAEIGSRQHRNTGQLIAKDEYLLQYELEHQKLLLKEGDNYERIKWSYALNHSNLGSYCFQYMGVSAPSRSREGVKGNWKTDLLYYQKITSNKFVMITTITCQRHHASKLHYHMTRALERNCVYALLRKGRSINTPYVIIYKHCDFEKPSDQQTIPIMNFNVHKKDVIPKSEVKEEDLEPLHFFLKD